MLLAIFIATLFTFVLTAAIFGYAFKKETKAKVEEILTAPVDVFKECFDTHVRLVVREVKNKNISKERAINVFNKGLDGADINFENKLEEMIYHTLAPYARKRDDLETQFRLHMETL